MAADLGTFIVVGPSSSLVDHIIANLGGIVCNFTTKINCDIIPTIGLHSCNSKVLQTKICLLEFSSINDYWVKLSNIQLLSILQTLYFTALSKGFKTKGFIVTASGYKDRLEVFTYLDKLFGVCGDQVKSSTVILSERLSVNQRRDNQNQNVIFERCEKLGIACVSWFSSIHLLTKESAKKQVSDFTTALNNMQPYYETWMTELKKKLKWLPK